MLGQELRRKSAVGRRTWREEMQERGLFDGVVVGGGSVAWLVTALVIDIGDGRARVEAARKHSRGIRYVLSKG